MSLKFEKIAETFENQMRKGFISALILLILNEGPSHGYKIIKKIEERTLGIWKPVASTMYPLLEKLEKNNLVKCVEIEVTGRQKKIYELTKEGEKTLNILVRRYQKMVRAMRSVITSVFGFDGNYVFEDFITLLPDDPIFGWKNRKSDEEKIENLTYQKALIEERILFLQEIYKSIDEELSKLESNGV
ncbi:MAG: PadR family transcriptional regulator [Promethearchaeota archaeon]